MFFRIGYDRKGSDLRTRPAGSRNGNQWNTWIVLRCHSKLSNRLRGINGRAAAYRNQCFRFIVQ